MLAVCGEKRKNEVVERVGRESSTEICSKFVVNIASLLLQIGRSA